MRWNRKLILAGRKLIFNENFEKQTLELFMTFTSYNSLELQIF